MPLSFPLLDKLMGQFEGFGISGTRATRNNNPGNLKYGDFAASHGATGADSNGFAVFPSVQSGLQAQDDLLSSYAGRGFTLGDTIASWNGNGANTPNYQNFVSQGSGMSLWDKLKQPFGLADQVDNALGTGIPGISPPGTSSSTTTGLIFGIGWARLAAFLIGLIVIGAGLMMFKPTQQIIVNTAKTAAKGAALAEVAAA